MQSAALQLAATAWLQLIWLACQQLTWLACQQLVRRRRVTPEWWPLVGQDTGSAFTRYS
jgi:hypothetical protein